MHDLANENAKKLQLLRDLLDLSKQGGSLILNLADHVQTRIENGSIADIRVQYTPRAMFEKDVMKIQNKVRCMEAEQLSLNQMRRELNERLELMETTHVTFETFTKKAEKLAPLKGFEELVKRVSRCALNDKTTDKFDCLEEKFDDLVKQIQDEYASKIRVD